MRRYMIVAAGLACTMAACRREPAPPVNQPKDRLLTGLRPPPLNRPIHQTADSQHAASVQVPAGPASALIVIRDGRSFLGVANLTGRLSISADRIRIEPNQGSPLELMYRLPAGVPALKADSGTGALSVVERTGPGGADRQVIVRLASGPLLAEMWRGSPRPLQLDLGNGVRLVQRAAYARAGAGYTEVPLEVTEAGRVVARVPLGRPTAIQAASGRYVAFAEVSHVFRPREADAGQVEGGYILRAWVVGAP